MTIQRQYSLPNCTLALEGFSDGSGNPADLRPVMAQLTNAECRLNGEVMRGGKDFFEGLVAAVSLYAQEVLSGIHVPVAADFAHMVRLEGVGAGQHQLTFAPAGGSPQIMKLNNVQLFDLVEAVDQFIADSQTLPQWSLGLKPASKQFAPKAPIANQALPIAAGLGSLALAAAAFFAMPTPSVKQPNDLTFGAVTSTATPGASPTTPPAASPVSSASPIASPNASPSPTEPTPAKITDTAVIDRLGSGLQQQLQAGFTPANPAPQAMVYRVSVDKDGKILGYRPEDPRATDFLGQTPLPDLRYNPVPGSPEASEPLADLRATFTPDGKVQVQAWDAPVAAVNVSSPSASPIAVPSPSAVPSPVSSPSPSPTPSAAPNASGTPGGEIVEVAAVKALQPKLYDQIDQQWKNPIAATDRLTFMVRVNSEGKVIEYAPYDNTAAGYKAETPLPQLGKEGSLEGKPTEAHATFKVVFTPGGQLEVNPWDGYAGSQP
jgi:hypothetical protein